MVTGARPRWYAYLLLARISNLPTVWTNVLAGLVAVQGSSVNGGLFVRIAAAVSLFYSGGMVLNDAFDAEFDRRARPSRPIPAGDVSRGEAFVVAALLMIAGEALVWPFPVARAIGVGLVAAIVLYDGYHKANALAPVVMGVCRALVYVMAAAAAGMVGTTALVGAAVIGVYIVGLTVVAKYSGPKAKWRVPVLLAGISIVDAIFIAVVSASLPLALLTASAFVVTLSLQRVVPGD